MKFSHKKIFVIFFIASMVFFIAPKKASAISTFETNPLVWVYNIFTSSSSSVTASATTGQLAQDILEWAFKLATETLRRQLLNMIVDQIVNWIQGGGTPKFVTDWPSFLQDAADQAGGKFLQQIGLGRFCSAFRPQLALAFIPVPKFSDRSSCTISQVGANLENFLTYFQSGGWAAWQEMVTKPQNNIYGAYVLAWDQYEIEKSAAQKVAESEAQAGRGFLNVKRCVQTEKMCDEEGYCTDECVKYETTTPGAVVGELAGKAVGSDIDYIVNADDLAAYVAAITNAILNRMMSEGLGALKTAFSGGGGGGGTGGSAGSAIQCSSLVGASAYNDCVTAIQSGADIKQFQKDKMLSLIYQDLSYQNQLLGVKQMTLTILNQSVDALTQLGTCEGSTAGALALTQASIQNITLEISKIQSDIIALQTKQDEIKAAADASRIATLFAQVAGVVNPASTQVLVYNAQQAASVDQQNLTSYQNQYTRCVDRQNQETGRY